MASHQTVLLNVTNAGIWFYFEHYREIRDAIAREKQLKGWRREKKNALISTLNPRWDDLAEDWF